MTHEEFKAKLKSILCPGFDTEIAHEEADELLITALTELGYDCSLFDVRDMWYA